MNNKLAQLHLDSAATWTESAERWRRDAVCPEMISANALWPQYCETQARQAELWAEQDKQTATQFMKGNV